MAEITAPVCTVPARRDPADLQLAVRDVCTFYGEAQALKNVDLSVYSNEVVAILGSNGAGKTTLLRTLTGLLAPVSGGIVFRGEPITGLSRNHMLQGRLEMVFSLFPILKERLRQRADTLSGGQQQMLAIGRALMAGPRLLALDEPSLGLSPVLVTEVMSLLKKICSELAVSLLLVEQNARAALKIADHVYVLERGAVVLHGACSEVLESEQIRRAYLGG